MALFVRFHVSTTCYTFLDDTFPLDILLNCASRFTVYIAQATNYHIIYYLCSFFFSLLKIIFALFFVGTPTFGMLLKWFCECVCVCNKEVMPTGKSHRTHSKTTSSSNERVSVDLVVWAIDMYYNISLYIFFLNKKLYIFFPSCILCEKRRSYVITFIISTCRAVKII